MKILFLTNIPSPYRVHFFNELGKHCELTVLFEKERSRERNKEWKGDEFRRFNGVFLKGPSTSTDMAICPGVLRYVKDRSFDRIICSDFTTPTGMLAVSYMKRHRIPYYLESDGGFAGSSKGIKARIKRWIIAGAKGYFSTADEHDRYYLTYGADPARIHRYPFTSLFSSDVADAPVTPEGKAALREMLNIKEKRIVLAVGQFIPRKGFDVLLDAARGLPRDIGFYFVGGTPTEEYTAFVEKHALTNVHFVGFCAKDALQRYYRAADLFVLPTREDIWGLVVNEAMAAALPVVTTTRCIAGLELVREGENGFLVPPADSTALGDAITRAFASPAQLAGMSHAALETIRSYTIECMVKRHLELLDPSGSAVPVSQS